MLLKFLVDEDFVNYKKCSMFIGFPYCTFKCDKENHNQFCHNYYLSHSNNTEYSIEKIYERYISNSLTHALVIGGLEPFDSFTELQSLIDYFRWHECFDDIVIYTGYRPEEIIEYLNCLQKYSNIIVKFGRFRPNQQPHYDELLGVQLANDEQFAERIS